MSNLDSPAPEFDIVAFNEKYPPELPLEVDYDPLFVPMPRREYPDPAQDMDRVLDQIRTEALVQQTLASMTKVVRRRFQKVILEGYPQVEVAEKEGVSTSRIHQAVEQGRKRLRALLNGDYR